MPDVEQYLRECIEIDALAIESEFVRIPADLAYWGERYAEAHRDYLAAKIDAKRITARMFLEQRIAIQADGERATEAYTNARVEESTTWLDAQNALLEAEARRESIKGTLDAVRAKRDMVVSLGAQIRAQMDHDPQINEEVGARRRVRG